MRFLVAFLPFALIACGTPATDPATDPATNNAGVPDETVAAATGTAPTVSNAWIRLPAVPGRPAAAYFTLSGGAVDDALVSVATPVAKRSELHESMESDGGVMSMAAIENVPLGAGAQMDFAPGGKHVMLFGIAPDLAAGGSTEVTVSFKQNPAVTVQAALVAPGGDAPAR